MKDRPTKPIQFAAMTLPHKQLRSYPDVGDWIVNADNSPAVICSADTGNDVSNAAILIHEIVESVLCWLHGVKEEDVTKFDQMWFKEQQEGKHDKNAEPGYDPRAPYRTEHFVASQIERHFITHCQMMWNVHEENIFKLYDDA